MRNIVLRSVLVCSVVAVTAGCGSGGDEIGSEQGSGISNLATLEAFSSAIVGNNLVLQSEDGTRDPSTQASVTADMKTVGFNDDGSFDLDWYWDNGAYCRSGVAGLPDNPVTIELECQSVDVNNIDNVVIFTRERGAGEIASSWFIE